MEEVKRYYSDNFDYISSDQPTLSILTNIARHFAEWGYLRAAEKYNEIEYNRQRAEESVQNDLEKSAKEYVKDIPTFKDSCLMKAAFEDGWLSCKEQMMKEAVEGTVMDFSSNQPRPQVDVLLDPHKYHTSDKVRIIIVKEN